MPEIVEKIFKAVQNDERYIPVPIGTSVHFEDNGWMVIHEGIKYYQSQGV